MSSLLSTPIEYLKGIGPQKGQLLRSEMEVKTYGDLLYYFPFRYVDKTQFHRISEVIDDNQFYQLRGKIKTIHEVGFGKSKRLQVIVSDASGEMELVWFKGIKWIKSSLDIGKEVIIFGKVKKFGAKRNIMHPELNFPEGDQIKGKLEPVYHSGEKLQRSGLGSKGIMKAISMLIPQVKGHIDDSIPPLISAELGLMDKEIALVKIHQPQTIEDTNRARFRLKFEELFYLQLELLMRKQINMQKTKGFAFSNLGNPFNDFFAKHLPFELTSAQKRVIREIRKDMNSGHHMNRLLQGDVGSGKTLVALLVMLIAIGNGFQTCLMAPTEILAQQHFSTLKSFLQNMDIKIELLTGSTKKSQRTPLFDQLEKGKVDILIGTHALLEKTVHYKNLGLAIIDEQHRFGVAQRSKLWKKNALPPHILVMTATPIPRTLALTFYGDLDVSVIDELPPGRKPIQTRHNFESSRLRVFEFMRQQLNAGNQIYIVYPLIEESEKMDYQNLMAGYEAISRQFPLPNYRISIVHGQMKPDDKEYEMRQFAEGKTNIMVATTVIEVGVNVPNASVMLIESAEKFGLSQLHQLRGRVGRGAKQSHCILMTGNRLSKEAKVRMETMVSTNDGFKISEVDLRLRGPGDVMGTQQSGVLDLKLADLARDAQLVTLAREKARELLDNDPKLTQPAHKKTAENLRRILKSKPNWSQIA